MSCFDKLKKGINEEQLNQQNLKDYFNVNSDETVWLSTDLQESINRILKVVSYNQHL